MNSYAQLCIVIHTYHYIFALLKANCTLKVGRWSPCPVLQQEARVFTPLSRSTFGRLPEQERGGVGGGAVYLVVGGRGTETPVLLEVCSVYLAGVAARYLLFFSL